MAILDKNTDYFGLDIGTTGIRMVQLKAGAGAPALVAYGAMAAPADLISSDSEIDHDRIAAVIRQLKDETQIKTNEVVTAIPSAHAFTTVITTPKLSESELAKSIQLQADQYIPMPVSEAKLDWHIIDPNKSETEMSVLLVAAPKNVVDKYLSVVEKAGLNLHALEINALATGRSVISVTEVPVAVVDFGNTSTEITVIWQRVPHLVRSVNIGGATLVRSVAQNLNIDEEQASQFLQKFGVTQTKLEGQVLKAVKGSLDSVMSEISKSIKFFTSQNAGVALEKVVLTGGPTALPEMPSYVANTLNLPVEIANPWMNVSYPAAQQDMLMGKSLQFAVAVGLAQRSFV
ncbi:MAG: type IV pilus assembly protein PilM [Candidatus Saccharimonadales bacterium]